MRVVVGTTNPVKLKAVEEALEELSIEAEVIPKEVDSGVPPVPLNDEVFEGAANRASVAGEGELGVGPESGLMQLHGRLFMVSVVAVKYEGKLHFGLSPGFELPERWSERVLRDRSEFFKMMEEMGGKDLGRRGGLESVLTNGVMVRKDFCKAGVIMALSKALNAVWR